MTTITHKILHENTGEQLRSYKTPQAVWTGQVDLNEERTYILSDTDFRPIVGNPYEVKELELPEWLAPEDYIQDWVYWDGVFGTMGMDVNQKLAGWMVGLEFDQMAAVKSVMTKKTKSEFTLSIRTQIQNWVDGNDTKSPLSPRQMAAIMPNRFARR